MTIIFDLDGTTLDTYEVIKHSYMDVFDKYLPTYKYTEEEIKTFFGPPLIDTFLKVVEGDKDKAEFLSEKYREISISNHYKYLKTFDKTDYVLRELKEKGYNLAIASNKAHSSIVLGLKIAKLFDYFDLIVGLDDVVKPKPDSECIDKIKKHFKDNKYILVGDTTIDIETGHNAMIDTIAVDYALTPRSVLEKAKPKYIASSMMDVLSYINKYQEE